MKKTLIIMPILLAFLISCPLENYEKLDAFLKRDTTPPVLLSFELESNRHLTFRFSEPCMIDEIRVGDLPVPHNDHLTEHHVLTMYSAVDPGSEKPMRLTVMDRAGNTSRYATTLTGINLDVPDTLITEVSSAGTQTSPDRIELTFLSDGTTEGLCLMDGAIGEEKTRFYLPPLDVKRNDICVIYWDREPRKYDTIIRDMNRTWIFHAGSEETLSSTNGGVVLYAHTNGDGKVMDALLWNRSDAELSDGFGNTRSRNTFLKMEKAEEWKGSTVESDRLTSSRVFSRWLPYEDTNESRDWYICAPRESSFGFPNSNREYIEK